MTSEREPFRRASRSRCSGRDRGRADARRRGDLRARLRQLPRRRRRIARAEPRCPEAAIARSDPLGAHRRRHASAGRPPERRRTPRRRRISQRPRARQRHHRRDASDAAPRRRRWPIPRPSPAWRGWSPSVTNTRFQSAQQAGLTAEQVPKLSLKWAFGFPDATSAWSQPTIAGGRVFVGSQNGTVYALDAKSGCIHWTFTAKSGVRTALVVRRARRRRQLRGLLRRHRRQRLRARRGDRARALVAAAGRSPLRADHRIADALPGSAVSCRSRRWKRPPPASRATSAARSAAA